LHTLTYKLIIITDIQVNIELKMSPRTTVTHIDGPERFGVKLKAGSSSVGPVGDVSTVGGDFTSMLANRDMD
jgi:hypothetical protein